MPSSPRTAVIRAVVAQHIRTARRMRLSARWFADCTGDGAVGALAGADFDMTQKQHMGPSNLWNVQDAGQPEPFPKCECEDTNAVNMAFASTKKPAPFPRCPWALDLSDKAFPGRQQAQRPGSEGSAQQAGRLVLGKRLRPRPDYRRGVDARPELPRHVRRLGHAQERG